MTKEEFVKKWGNHSIYHAIMPDINSVIQQAIAEREALKTVIKAKAIKEHGNNDKWLKYSTIHQAWVESEYPVPIFNQLPLVPTFAELIDIEIIVKAGGER